MPISTTGNCNSAVERGQSVPLDRFLASPRGFTLLELIVVMVLLAITVSLAVPRLASFFSGDQLKTGVRRLVGLIHQCSQLAQRQQLPYLLRYIDGEHRFVVEPERRQEEDGAAAKARGLRLSDSVRVQDLWTWYGGTRAGEDFVIRFTKGGYVEPTVIHLRATDGAEISVVLSPFLGKVEVRDHYVTPESDGVFQ